MSCRTGTVERADVERVLVEMGWSPDHPEDSEYLASKKAEIVARLPEQIRAEITALDPVLITTFPNVWGLASFDRRNLLLLVLFADDLSVIKQQCAQVAITFPRTFARVLAGRRCDFDSHVEIRRFDGNGLIARGIISETGHVPFRRYVWAVRRRERVTLLVLAVLCALSTAGAIALYLWFPGDGWAYTRGYLDRFATAVLTAGLIMIVSLIFEYRTWKGASAMVEWSVHGE
jgi:hypothetical protein